MADASLGRRPPGDDNEGPFHGLRNWLRQLTRSRNGETTSLREELEELIEEHKEEQPIDPHERTLLTNILKLHELNAADIMVPRVDIVAIEVDTPFHEAVKQIVEWGHSRVPLYRETLDDVLGMIHIKDLLPYAADGKPVPLAKIARKVLFAAPSMPVLDLLLQMRLSRVHMALVVDEFGGIDGLVTIEDVIEEIVGEIEDEHDDADQPKLIERADGTAIADARIKIDTLQERMPMALLPPDHEEGIESLGGLVTALAGHVPSRGEVVRHPAGLEFEVLDADPRRVKRLRLRGLPPKPADPDA
jgi:magnesium and cobalt transporter